MTNEETQTQTSESGNTSRIPTLAEYWQQFEQMLEVPELIPIKTGFSFLDEQSGGLDPSGLHVLAARPGQGKTSLAVSLALKICEMHTPEDPHHEKTAVLFFSLEMPSVKIHRNLASNFLSIPLKEFKKPKKELWATHGQALRELPNFKIYIFDNPTVTPEQIADVIDQAKAKGYEVKAVIIDHIQLLSQNIQGANIYERTTQASRSLKKIALLKSVPIVALAQLSREVEKGRSRKGLEPVNADIRDSGSIEQDADFIAMIYKVPEDFKLDKNLVRIKVTKNREGEPKGYALFFDGSLSKFYELNEQGNLNYESFSTPATIHAEADK
ncbi:DnaB family ATPase [Mycoplasmopsis columboralis]|uniref:Repb n=1 Tax=Mycoplasmopsis columboralis TaxID=171282 RepID=A0A449B5S7_9BACT|nr:DnaB family ATPase [Mycoplasmopsis columboralis]VEU75957.1 repb [Mycoplasmopsis columboralis]